MLQLFCPSASNTLMCHSVKVLIDETQIESDEESVDDEVVDADIHLLKQFCTETGWKKLESICKYVEFVYIIIIHACVHIYKLHRA